MEIVIDFPTLLDAFDDIEQLVVDGYHLIIPSCTIRRRKEHHERPVSVYFAVDRYVRDGSIGFVETEARSCEDAVVAVCEERSAPLLTYDPVYASKAISRGVSLFQHTYTHYRGYGDIYVEREIFDALREHHAVDFQDARFSPNQYFNVKCDSAAGVLARYDATQGKLVRLPQNIVAFGQRPKNLEQTFALDALLNPDIPLVTIEGTAGSGKNFLALAAAFEQVLERRIYKRIVITRLVVPIGRDIGYLPGSKKAKMSHWLAAFSDNAEKLLSDPDMFNDYIEKRVVELESLSLIRGRELHDAFIICDEAQNLNRHQVRTVVTRVGENSKLVVLGDTSQIDEPSVYVVNGFSYLIDRMKASPHSAHVHLSKTVRSKIAEEAARLL